MLSQQIVLTSEQCLLLIFLSLTSSVLEEHLIIEPQPQLWHASQPHFHLHRPHNLTLQHLAILTHLEDR